MKLRLFGLGLLAVYLLSSCSFELAGGVSEHENVLQASGNTVKTSRPLSFGC